MDLASPVQFVKGVGPQRAEALAREGVTTVEDLLFHLPMRYEDRRQLAPHRRPASGHEGLGLGHDRGGRAAPGPPHDPLRGPPRGRERPAQGALVQPALPEGRAAARARGGPVRHGGARRLRRAPAHDVVAAVRDGRERGRGGVHTGRIVPVYEKLGPAHGEGAAPRSCSRLAEQVPDDLPDPLPADVRERLGVIARAEALRRIHRPRRGRRPRAAERARAAPRTCA